MKRFTQWLKRSEETELFLRVPRPERYQLSALRAVFRQLRLDAERVVGAVERFVLEGREVHCETAEEAPSCLVCVDEVHKPRNGHLRPPQTQNNLNPKP